MGKLLIAAALLAISTTACKKTESGDLEVEKPVVGTVTFSFDNNRSYVGDEERGGFAVLAARGRARLAPLRVVKELNGRPTDVSPGGATSRDSAFVQSYRAELAHFIAVVNGESKYEAPTDQVTLHRILEAIYKSAEEEKEVRL